MIVHLLECECEMVETAGLWMMDRVWRESLGTGHGDARRTPEQRLADTVRGLIAEMATAKARGIYWNPNPEDFGSDGRDVGGYQVRSTSHQRGHLIVFPQDIDTRLALLVIVGPRVEEHGVSCRLVGTIRVGDAKQDCYATVGRRAGSRQWWVPQDALEPFAAAEMLT